MAATSMRFLIAMIFGFSFAQAQTVFINEFHYDNMGTDQDEGVEIAGPAGTNLACYKVLLYNGANGLVYNTLTLSGSIPDVCNGFGSVWFPASLQNGAPDGFALVLDSSLCGGSGSISVIQFLSYEGAITANNGDAVGMTSTNLPVAEDNGTTPVGSSVQLTGNGTVYTDFTWTSGVSTHDAVNNGQTFNGACGAVVASQLTFTSVPTGCILTGQAFDLVVCATNGAGSIDASYSGTVTIAKASGFGNLGGTLTGSLSGGCITFSGLTVDALDAYTFSATDGSLSGTSQTMYTSSSCTRCPNLTGSMIDACGTSEGRNEVLFLNSGDYSIPLNYPDFNITYGSTPSPTTTYSNGFTSNTAYVDSLNAYAGCLQFVDAFSQGVIPPQTAIMLMRSNPDYTYNFSAWCGQAPIYVVFTTDANWVEIGNFKNCIDCGTTGATPRFFRANFTNLTGGAPCDFHYNYTPCSDLVCPGSGTGNSSGDGLSWPYGGGGPDSTWNECTPTAPSLLPVLFGAPLRASWVEGSALLTWTTEYELNASHFVIERRSPDSPEFEAIGTQTAVGYSNTPQSYSFVDFFPAEGSAFYRLRQLDLDGSEILSNIAELRPDPAEALSLEVKVNEWADLLTFALDGKGVVEIQLYSLAGQLVHQVPSSQINGPTELSIETTTLASGLYLYDLRVGPVRRSGKVSLH